MKKTALVLLLVAFLVTAFGCNLDRDPMRLLPVLTSVSVRSEPKIDGLATDPAWKTAEAVKIKTKGGPEVTMRSVHTGSNIYLTASWADKTKDDVDEVWEFSDTGWTRGPIDDAFAIFWNAGDQIPGFKTKGCDAVCHERGGQTRMELAGKAKGTADIWDISLGISNIRGSVNDYVFTVDPAYLKDPENMKPRLMRRHDDFSRRAPIILNYSIDPATGKLRPKYLYKDGLTIESTPYPFVYEVDEIKDFSVFKAGARLPFIIFYPFSEKWGGSRDDISGKGVWKDGRWTVEIKRKLKTGYKDDIDFTVRKEPVTFAIAVFNRTIVDHKTSKPVRLEIE